MKKGPIQAAVSHLMSSEEEVKEHSCATMDPEAVMMTLPSPKQK